MRSDCCKVGRNLTGLENILSRGMASVFVRSVVVVASVAAGAASAHAQERGPQRVSIDDALEGARTTAAGLAAARARIVGAQAQVDEARSGYLPQINASANYTLTLASEFSDVDLSFNFGAILCPIADDTANVFCEQRYQDIFNPPDTGDDSGGLPFGQRNTWRVGASAAQAIYTGGRLTASVKAAKVGVALARLSEQQLRASAVLAVVSAYYAAQAAQRGVEIAQASVDSAQAVVDQSELAHANGALAEFDLVRAQVARDNARVQVVAATRGRDAAFLNLKRLLRLPADRAIELTSGLDLGAGDDGADPDDVSGKALAAAGLATGGKRLALIQAELAVDVSKHARAIAAADRLPQVTAVSDFGLVDYGTQPFNADWRTNWTVGVNVSFPIFDGFRRRAAVAKADADLAAARADRRDAEDAAGADAAAGDVAIAAALTNWQASARTVELAKRAYQIAELRYTQGASTQLELIDARLQLNVAENNQAQSARDLRIARLRQALLPGLRFGEGL